MVSSTVKKETFVAIVVAGLVGLIAGVVIGYMVGKYAPGQTPAPASDLNRTVEEVVEKINSMVHASSPQVNVRVAKIEPYGELYLLNLEFYNESGVLSTQSVFMTGNGDMLLLKDPACAINLSEKSEQPAQNQAETQPSKINVDDDPYRGRENAKVVIVEFSDYACPYCARFANEVEPKILENYGDRIKIVYRDFPVHEDISYKAAEAADCAGEQGKYWEYHDLLFKNQREWMENTSKLYDYAKQLGLNTTAFKACLDSGKYKSEVDNDMQDGLKYGVSGTPTFFINGKMVVGYMPYEEFARLIEQELQR